MRIPVQCGLTDPFDVALTVPAHCVTLSLVSCDAPSARADPAPPGLRVLRRAAAPQDEAPRPPSHRILRLMGAHRSVSPLRGRASPPAFSLGNRHPCAPLRRFATPWNSEDRSDRVRRGERDDVPTPGPATIPFLHGCAADPARRCHVAGGPPDPPRVHQSRFWMTPIVVYTAVRET